MNKLSTLIPLVCATLIVGCGKEPASVPPVIERVAYAHLLTNGTYEIQLRYSVTTSGGPCLNKDWFTKYTHYSTNWFYLKALDRAATADEVVVRAGVVDEVGDFRYVIEGLRGTVSFDKDMMTVQFQQPHILSSGAVQGHVPYYLNGMYQIVSR